MASTTLRLTESERAKFEADGALGTDSRGNEILLGLNPDETERHLQYIRGPITRKTEAQQIDARYLAERHQRALFFGKIARGCACGNTHKQLTAEQAFEIGRSAWKVYGGADQMRCFVEMIEGVPRALRSAAINGWLNAFDDEADRLGLGNPLLRRRE